MPRGTPRKTRGRAGRYSFLVRNFHSLLPAGLSRRFPEVRVLCVPLRFFPSRSLRDVSRMASNPCVGFGRQQHAVDGQTAGGYRRMVDASRIIMDARPRPEEPQRNPSADGYLCAITFSSSGINKYVDVIMLRTAEEGKWYPPLRYPLIQIDDVRLPLGCRP
jgi:hypothetical protein